MPQKLKRRKDKFHQETNKSKAIAKAYNFDEDIPDDDIDSNNDDVNDDSIDSEEELYSDENDERKRRRLAKEYLSNFDRLNDNGNLFSHNEVSNILTTQRLLNSGKLFRDIDTIEVFTTNPFFISSSFKKSFTCVAVSDDNKTVFAGSKDGSILRWELDTRIKRILKPAWNYTSYSSSQFDNEILSIAVSVEGKFVAASGRDKIVRIFDGNDSEIFQFKGHKDAVTCLSFHNNSSSLFSGSLDRSIKHWDVSQMGYVETLFGHQSGVISLDCFIKQIPISSSIDRTLRLWKISEETHAAYRGSKSSIDSVQYLTDDIFVSGCEDGSINVWKNNQKRPIATVNAAHGSCDGFIRIWNFDPSFKNINSIGCIPLSGHINALAFSSSLIAAATGREHKFGRWNTIKGNHNRIVAFKYDSHDKS